MHAEGRDTACLVDGRHRKHVVGEPRRADDRLRSQGVRLVVLLAVVRYVAGRGNHHDIVLHRVVHGGLHLLLAIADVSVGEAAVVHRHVHDACLVTVGDTSQNLRERLQVARRALLAQLASTIVLPWRRAAGLSAAVGLAGR